VNDSIPAARRLIEAAKHTLTEGNPERKPGNLVSALSYMDDALTDLEVAQEQADRDHVRRRHVEGLALELRVAFVGGRPGHTIQDAAAQFKACPEVAESWLRVASTALDLIEATPTAPVHYADRHEHDPEPGRTTHWFTSDGENLAYAEGCWITHQDGARIVRHWEDLPGSVFPLRRDLDAELYAQHDGTDYHAEAEGVTE